MVPGTNVRCPVLREIPYLEILSKQGTIQEYLFEYTDFLVPQLASCFNLKIEIIPEDTIYTIWTKVSKCYNKLIDEEYSDSITHEKSLFINWEKRHFVIEVPDSSFWPHNIDIARFFLKSKSYPEIADLMKRLICLLYHHGTLMWITDNEEMQLSYMQERIQENEDDEERTEIYKVEYEEADENYGLESYAQKLQDEIQTSEPNEVKLLKDINKELENLSKRNKKYEILKWMKDIAQFIFDNPNFEIDSYYQELGITNIDTPYHDFRIASRFAWDFDSDFMEQLIEMVDENINEYGIVWPHEIYTLKDGIKTMVSLPLSTYRTFLKFMNDGESIINRFTGKF
ncbi:MAG TPA: hypothetical protein PKK33_11020 [Candidatus Cloacimonadota bacterium]|nr:hypothetical protein [Candidatus Cloacimonadota bacterium]